MAISKIILNGVTQMDLTQDTVAASNLISPNTAHGADGLAVTGTATAGGNDFIVTLSYNSTSQMWEPDCTWAELSAAYSAGKNIYSQGSYYGTTTSIVYYEGEGGDPSYCVYCVSEPGPCIKYTESIFDSNGILIDNDYDGYQTWDADAVASDVLSGKYFYNSTGKVAGSATARSSSDLIANGATVTAPAGFYTSAATKTVASGTEGTPTATKGTVSNHQVSVTPSVTNTAGYISGGTKTGTAITVSASELASGNKAIADNGTGIDVVGYSTVSVNVTPSLQSKTNISPTTSSQTITADNGYDGLSSVQINAMPSGTAGTPSATKGTVSNHSISVTPSVTNTTGYITGGTKTGTAVTVSASELVSGTYTVDSSGTKDVTNYASASVSAGTAGTPSATKGTVSNHQVSVTPSVTNTTGWIAGSTKTGTAVTVTASELASGNKAIVDNGTNIDVVGYSTVSVAVPFNTIHTGSSNPASSLGSNGDVYIKVVS